MKYLQIAERHINLRFYTQLNYHSKKWKEKNISDEQKLNFHHSETVAEITTDYFRKRKTISKVKEYDDRAMVR